MIDLENRLRLLESTISFIEIPDCLSCREELKNVYEKIANGLKIRSELLLVLTWWKSKLFSL